MGHDLLIYKRLIQIHIHYHYQSSDYTQTNTHIVGDIDDSYLTQLCHTHVYCHYTDLITRKNTHMCGTPHSYSYA